ncbi:MAG: PQQ-binding-like beta-propeller repeat protein, partial [Betaproteobacteria bacterium]|nr:PQQ-binding-like beta-propeller repeat protein [Betaproteobacteria bacterium]
YVAAYGPNDCAVARLDPADGHEIWRQTFSNSNGVHSAKIALASDGTVLVTCSETVQMNQGQLRTVKINTATGTIVWNVTTTSQGFGLRGVAAGTAGEAFVLAGTINSSLYIATLFKLGSATGELVWQSPVPGGGEGSLAVDSENSAFAFTTQNYHQLTKFSGDTGAQIWTTPFAGSSFVGAGALQLNAAGDIFLATVGNHSDGSVPATLYKFRSSDGQPIWQSASPAPYKASSQSVVLGPGGSVYSAGMGQEVGRSPAGYVRRIVDTTPSGPPINPVLAINFTGAGKGSVSVAGQALNCTSPCGKAVAAGTTVVLKAVANGNSQFAGWTGGGCSGVGDCTTTINVSTTVTANFLPRVFTLNVIKTGNGGGRVVSNPPAIDCGAVCSSEFVGTAAVPGLTATPDADSLLSSNTTSCLPLTQKTIADCIQAGASSVTVTYVFTRGDFSIVIDGLNGGRIVSTPPGIDCISQCSARFPAGTQVTLKAMPSELQIFVGWGFVYGLGQCIQQTADTCTVNDTAFVRSQFDLKPAVVTVVKTGGGSGTVTSSSPGIDCGPTCTASLPGASSQVLTATPAPGSVFGGFSGCQYLSSTCEPYRFVASTVEARFELASEALPSAPRQVQAFPGDRQATIHFLPPLSTGLAPVTYYQVQCQPGNIGPQSQVSPVRLNGLVNGTQYACTLFAVNKFGQSPAVSFDVTPSASAAFSFVAAKSQKTHVPDYTLLTGDIDIDLTKSVTDSVTVEPRVALPHHTVIFQFSDRVNATGSVSVKDASGMDVGVPLVSIVNNDVLVSLANMPNGKRVTVSLTGVNEAVNATASIGFLVGDVDGNGRIDAADLAAIRTRAGQRVFNPSNLRYDLNLSGYVTASDVLVVKRRQGSTLQ